MLRPTIRRIPEYFEQRPITEVAAELELRLSPDAPPWHVCLCPLHNDHDPSLRVNVQENYWICHPCGLGGDALELVYRVRHSRNPDFSRYDAYLTVVQDTTPTDHLAARVRSAPGRITSEGVILAGQLRGLRASGYGRDDLFALTEQLLEEDPACQTLTT